MTASNNPVLYFDGVCNLCNSTVQYIIRHDKQQRFLFASLQSEAGQTLQQHYKLQAGKLPDSIILSYKGKLFIKSDAALHTLMLLGGFYKPAVIAFIIPRFIRDGIYDWVAKNRYKWYGKRQECMIPTPALQRRFLG